MRLVWKPAALRELEQAADWSPGRALAVFEAMETMAEGGWSLGRPARDGLRYWPVPPYGVLYQAMSDVLVVVRVVDTRGLRDELP